MPNPGGLYASQIDLAFFRDLEEYRISAARRRASATIHFERATLAPPNFDRS